MSEVNSIIEDFNHDMGLIEDDFKSLQNSRGQNSSYIMSSINNKISLCNGHMNKMVSYNNELAQKMEEAIDGARDVYNKFLDAGY